MADDEYSILNTQCQYELSYMEMTELFQVPTIHSSDQKTLELLANIKYFYENCLFCDVKLVAGNADHNFNSVPCHSLVIVSAIPRLLHIFESAFENVEDICRIYLPEFSYHELKIFVDNLYSAVTNNTDCIIDFDLATCFGLRPDDLESNLINVTCLSISNTTKSNEQIVVEATEESPFESIPVTTPKVTADYHSSLHKIEISTRKSGRKRKKIVNENTSGDDDSILNEDFVPPVDDEEKEEEKKILVEEKPKKRGRQSSRSVSNDNQKPSPEQQQQQPKQEIKEVCQKLSLDQLIDSQLNNLTQLLPFNWSLTDPSLFSNANEYQKLLEDCQDSGTVIHALTGCPFNFTKETIHSHGAIQDNVNWNESYGNNINKLIRLPKTTISAIVAVGLRNGLNIVQPVALQGWPIKANFENLLEMLLNVAGTSKAKFFDHDRYYKFKKMSSKPNRIGRAMQSIKKLSEEDRESLRNETLKDVQNLEAVRTRPKFNHLPVIAVKMQFSHVSDMTSEEILDYAVLYGNETSDLNIKSFNNMEVRDYIQDDWISIFIDLMVDILSIENPLVLRTHATTKDFFEPVDQLLFKSAAFELISNPTKKYCIPCRTVFPYTTSKEIAEFEVHIQDHSIKKEDLSSGLLSCTGSAKCSKLFQNQEALAEHVAKSHDKSVKGDGSYCDTCGKFLPNVHRLKKHHDAHHRQIKCKICSAYFPGTIGLASHRDRVHSQLLPCPHCEKLLPSKVKLEYHMISHMTPEEKKYICEKCGKRFGWSHHLAKHEMNVHVRTRPYKCSVQGCNWAFNDLSNRNMHERRVHKLGAPPKR